MSLVRFVSCLACHCLSGVTLSPTDMMDIEDVAHLEASSICVSLARHCSLDWGVSKTLFTATKTTPFSGSTEDSTGHTY